MSITALRPFQSPDHERRRAGHRRPVLNHGDKLVDRLEALRGLLRPTAARRPKVAATALQAAATAQSRSAGPVEVDGGPRVRAEGLRRRLTLVPEAQGRPGTIPGLMAGRKETGERVSFMGVDDRVLLDDI